MKIHALILVFGAVVGVTTVGHAQNAPAPADPLSDLQKDFGDIVGEAFRRPDPIVAAVSKPGSPVLAAGVALRTSMEIPGAVFAGALKPLADADAKVEAPPPAPTQAPAPRHRRNARGHHHRASGQG